MDDAVAELARAERLVEAAELATARGDLRAASELFERACDPGRAAQAALGAGEPGRALTLAALAGADTTAAAALDQLSRSAREGALVGLATELGLRGLHAWAGRTFEAAGDPQRAAEAWERAGDAVRAASLLEGARDGGGAARAARVLEAGLRRDPDRPDLLVALGGLLLRCGKATAALRALQRVPDAATEKAEALRLSLQALAELGLPDAKAEVERQLAARGGAVEPAPGQPGRTEGRARARLYGRYEVVREVSSTATARVLECRDTLRGDRVALKVFSPQADATRGAGRDALARFAREARVLARLAHASIATLRDVLEQGPALVLEWMPGGTLEELLATAAPPPARAVEIACAVLRALGEAHRLGIVHRDVKPANILFDAAGAARLSDFGVAHLGDLSITATAASFGSLAYMSPEQREGRPATAASDLYSVGVVLLEMLTGTRAGPVDDQDLDGGLPEPLSTFHRELGRRHDQVVASLVARTPSRRPADAFAAERALASLAWPADLDVTARTARPPPRAASVPPPPERLEPAGKEATGDAPRATDRWLERPIVCVPLTERTLAAAIVFARAAHRALQPVLRVDRAGGTLWLGAPLGEPLDRPLTQDERAVLEQALALLHAAGTIHGTVGRGTVFVGRGGPILGVPTRDAADGTVERDREALRRL